MLVDGSSKGTNFHVNSDLRELFQHSWFLFLSFLENAFLSGELNCHDVHVSLKRVTDISVRCMSLHL